MQDKNAKLLYRGSRDGYRASDFHSKCDGKKNQLTLIKSESGRIFGGYQSKPRISPPVGDWKSSDDKSAFIFSVSDQKKFPVSNSKKAIQDIDSFGPTFGNFDILIYDNCNLTSQNRTDFGDSYSIPDELKLESDENAKSYLAGSNEFKVVEIEVFALI